MKEDRIVFLDVLRGFALFGILYAHFVIWFTGSALPESVYKVHSDTPSMVALAIFGTLVLGKFFSIFSFLFGMSFCIQKKSRSNIGGSTRSIVIRLIALITLGFVHHLFWRGDILMIYGILGFGLLIMDRFSSRTLIIWAIFFLLNIPGLLRFFSDGIASLPMAEDSVRHLWLMQHGELSDFLRDNLAILDNKLAFQIESGRLSRTFGFFLLGIYASREGWFTSDMGSRFVDTLFRMTRTLLLLLATTAAVLFFTGVIWFDTSVNMFSSALPLSGLFNAYNVLLSIFLIASMHRLYRSGRWRDFLDLFRYPGKMAMSVYIMQTVIGLALFYPFGLHLFAATSPAVNALLVIPAFLIQVYWCKWWLSQFNQGPLEWLTRSIIKPEYGSTVSRPAPEMLRSKLNEDKVTKRHP